MPWVILCTPGRVHYIILADPNFISFSFPFDMMKEGGDVNGYWQAVSASLSYAIRLSHTCYLLISSFTIRRTCTMAQIPWVPAGYIGSMLAKLGNDSILPLATKMVGHRLQAGSSKRDLFHHLVS